MSASMTAAEVRWRDMTLGTRLWPSTSEVQEIYIGLSNIGGPSKTASEQRVPGADAPPRMRSFAPRHLVCVENFHWSTGAAKSATGISGLISNVDDGLSGDW